MLWTEVTNIDGLLHLASMAVLIAAGYIGIDRVRRDEANHFKNILVKVKNKVRAELFRLDMLIDGTAELEAIYSIEPVHILCHIAEVPVVIVDRALRTRCEVGIWTRFSNCCKRQRDIPALIYFRNRFDRKLVMGLSITASLDFLVLIAGTIYTISFVHQFWFVTLSFLLCAFTVITVFITAALVYPLLKIDAFVDKLLMALGAHAAEIMRAKVSEGMRELANRNHPHNGQPPRTNRRRGRRAGRPRR